MGTASACGYGTTVFSPAGPEGLVVVQGADPTGDPGGAPAAEAQVQSPRSDARADAPAAEIEPDTGKNFDAFSKRPAHGEKRVSAGFLVAVQRVSAACSRAAKSNPGPRNGKRPSPFGEKASCIQVKTLCLKWELGSVLTIQMWKPAREKYPLYTSAVTSARADRVFIRHSCLATVVYKTSPGRCLPD